MMLRSGTRYLGRYAPAYALASYAGRQLGRAVRARTGRSFTATTNRRNVKSGAGITTQYDRRLIYRKRYMPRGKKRRWKAFTRKVNAVAERDLGSRTVVRNNQINSDFVMNQANTIGQGTTYMTLYSNNGILEINNDMRTLRGDTDLGTTGKMIVKSGVLDMTVTNNSERDGDSNNRSIRLEVDVYEMTSGVWWANSGTGATATTLDGVWTEGSTETATIPGGTSGLTITRRGATPFDLPSALSEYKLKILKKTKYFINEGDTFTYQIRDPKRYVFDRQSLNRDGENIPYKTRFLFFVWRPVPGYEYTDVGPDTARLTIGVTRKYMYKINANNQDFDRYNS